MKLLFLLCVFLSFFSCIKTIYLQDGITYVAINSKVYANRSKFTTDIFSVIDTNAIYEECIFENENYIPKRLLPYKLSKNKFNQDIIADNFCLSLKFYGNGNVNFFAFGKFRNDIKDDYKYYFFNENNEFYPDLLNPEYTGSRGIYYWDKNKKSVIIELLGLKSGIMKITKTNLYFSEDKEIFTERERGQTYNEYVKPHFFIKKKFPPDFFKYKADW